MKKYLVLILIILAACSPQKKTSSRAFQVVNVGTTANDGTGDNLRAAWIKQNANWLANADSLALKATKANPVFTGTAKIGTDTLQTKAGVRVQINDTIEGRIAVATELSSVAWLKSDTTGYLATKTDILNVEASGGSGTFYRLSGNIDGSGFPGAGDSTLTHTNFPGKDINLFRDGVLQQRHVDNTEQDGFKFNNTTGTITVRPVFSAAEQIEIWLTNTIQWQALTGEESGGASSDLLTDLLAYWQLDEPSGSVSYEEVGSYNATTTGVTGGVGEIGLSTHYTGTQGSQVGHTAALVPAGDAMTVGMYFKLDSLPSVTGRTAELMAFKHSASPWNSMELMIDSNDKLYFYIKNTGATSYAVYSTDAFDAGDLGTWFHVAVVCTASGSALKLYVDGSDVSASAGTFTGTFYQHDSGLAFGNEYNGGTNATEGSLDEVFIYNAALSAADIQELMTKTYPFN